MPTISCTERAIRQEITQETHTHPSILILKEYIPLSGFKLENYF